MRNVGKKVAMLVYEWGITGAILGPIHVIFMASHVVGRERAGAWASRWIHFCHRVLSGGCATVPR